jgi:hypothetical protein
MGKKKIGSLSFSSLAFTFDFLEISYAGLNLSIEELKSRDINLSNRGKLMGKKKI